MLKIQGQAKAKHSNSTGSNLLIRQRCIKIRQLQRQLACPPFNSHENLRVRKWKVSN